MSDSAFQDAKTLKYLKLRSNKIRFLTAGQLKGLDSLESIDLFDNILESLGGDMFIDSPLLRHVDVSYNIKVWSQIFQDQFSIFFRFLMGYFLHKTFCIFYTANCAFFTPICFTPKFCIFLNQVFYTKHFHFLHLKFYFLTPKILRFLHQKVYFLYIKNVTFFLPQFFHIDIFAFLHQNF